MGLESPYTWGQHSPYLLLSVALCLTLLVPTLWLSLPFLSTQTAADSLPSPFQTHFSSTITLVQSPVLPWGAELYWPLPHRVVVPDAHVGALFGLSYPQNPCHTLHTCRVSRLCEYVDALPGLSFEGTLSHSTHRYESGLCQGACPEAEEQGLLGQEGCGAEGELLGGLVLGGPVHLGGYADA